MSRRRGNFGLTSTGGRGRASFRSGYHGSSYFRGGRGRGRGGGRHAEILRRHLNGRVSGSNTSSSVNPNSNTGSGPHAQLVPESPSIQFSPPNVRRGTKRAGKGRNTNVGSGSGSSGGGAMTARRKPGHSPIERPLPISIESNYETSELRGTRRQLPSGRSGPAFRHAIQEEDEGEEE